MCDVECLPVDAKSVHADAESPHADAKSVHADAESLRSRLTELLGFAVPARPPELVAGALQRRDGYAEQAVSFTGDEGDVPALLLVPEHPRGAGVVVHHQHHSQWQLGKSEVAGLCGDPWQAFGPALARRGVTVIAHDAVGFEDRRPGAPRVDARASDASDYFKAMCYRLVQGRPLMCTVLGDGAAAHSVLAGLDGVDERRVGAVGHSMGGASVLLHAALDERIAAAVVSGAACTYRERMARSIGIECAQVIPGLLEVGDLDEIAALVSPRPLLLCSSDEDEYSRDAPRIAEAAAGAYRSAGAPQALQHLRAHGGHALTEERFAAIVDWVVARLDENQSSAGGHGHGAPAARADL
jgi:dienelactone hydrolase